MVFCAVALLCLIGFLVKWVLERGADGMVLGCEHTFCEGTAVVVIVECACIL